jgi:aryl-alcohol dehydrogenase-like predicted oxidoreductase
MNLSMAQVAVAWSLAQEGTIKPQSDIYVSLFMAELPVYTGVTAPIVGTTSIKNLEEIIGQCHLNSSDWPGILILYNDQ